MTEPVVVIKPLFGTGECNNTILCITCVFWETVSICAAVHLCNWNYFILNHIIPSTESCLFILRVAQIVTPPRFATIGARDQD